MKTFDYIKANSLDEAGEILAASANGAIHSGGTDLMGCLRDRIWMEDVDVVVSVASIEELKHIRKDGDALKIGAMTTLADIAASALVKESCRMLAQAAQATASPQLRNVGTIAGNICQENRCWYYRYSYRIGGIIECIRKGGKKCLAVGGDHRYHSIFGAVNRCVAVNPSDTAPALVAADATIATTKRNISAREFFTGENGKSSTVLDNGDIVKEISVPLSGDGVRSAFKKVALRKSIDFAIISCAAQIALSGGRVENATICLGGVHVNPRPMDEAAGVLKGEALSDELIECAANVALEGAKPLKGNRYKVQIAKAIILDTLSDCIL